MVTAFGLSRKYTVLGGYPFIKREPGSYGSPPVVTLGVYTKRGYFAKLYSRDC